MRTPMALLIPVLALVPLAGCTGILEDAGVTRDLPAPLAGGDAAACVTDAANATVRVLDSAPQGTPPRVDGTVTWREDVARTGYVPDVRVPANVSLAWCLPDVNTGEHTAAKGSAVLAEDLILVAGDTGVLHALTPAGERTWAAGTGPSKNGIHGTAAVHDGVAFIGAYDGVLYAFDLDDGKLLWATKLGGSIGSSPVYHDGRVFVSVETPKPSGIMSVVDAEDGRLLWEDEGISDHPHSSVALDLDLGIMVVGANDGVLYAWDVDSYERLWTFEAGDDIKGPIAVWDGAAFFGSWDRKVYRVDLATGEKDWSVETRGKVMSGAAIDPTTGTVFIGGHDARVRALDAATGEQKWEYRTGGSITSSPVVTENAVLVGSYDEHLYALDKATGEPLWRFRAAGQVTSSALVADGLIGIAERADERGGAFYVLAPAP